MGQSIVALRWRLPGASRSASKAEGLGSTDLIRPETVGRQCPRLVRCGASAPLGRAMPPVRCLARPLRVS
jgi:hypothetical protein